MMLPVLGAALALETVLGFLLISKVPPLEKLACKGMDLTHTPKGSAVVKTLAGTLLIFLASSISTYVTTKSHLYESHHTLEGLGHIAPQETYVLRTAELESAMTGFILLLALMINRVHYYLRGKRGLTLQLEILKKQSKSAETEYMRLKDEGKMPTVMGESTATGTAADGTGSEKEIIGELRKKVETMQNQLQAKDKELKGAESNAQAIRKQSEGMAQEYERLMEDNENLRSQVATFDRDHSRSSFKKDS